MKKVYLVMFMLLAFGFSAKAQLYVSTEPANRNVILEEYTGRSCGYCTDGHAYANSIMASNPGRVWAINIHYGSLSPTSYPNLNLPQINPTLSNAFPHDGIPSGVVNRSTAQGQNRGAWSGLASNQLNQAAECNVAGVAKVNPDTRIATITVEVYYTGNSSVNENYLTVVMLQDSILGAQSDYGNYNPSGWLNGQYVHMHVLRDMVTEGIWGDAISPTTQGTLITKTYEYHIPDNIGSPNGVDVVLDHINFLAFVSERYQGTPTRPILNACELQKITMTDEPIYPIVEEIEQDFGASCSQNKTFNMSLLNIGTEEITSMKYTAQVGDVSAEFGWEGSMPSGESVDIMFDLDLPFGAGQGTLQIIEANGTPYDYQKAFQTECLEWTDVFVNTDVTSLKIYLIQDQFGEQITWDIINSAGETVAEGGPYSHLVGAGATQPNIIQINDVPVNDCYLFSIYDTQGNGICCNYGNGYYYVKDGNGNVIFGGEGNGDFGSKASHMFSIVNLDAISVTTQEPQILGEHEAMFVGNLDGNAVEVGFEYKKLVDPTPITVQGEMGENNVFSATVDGLKSNTMYSVKAFAVVAGNKKYGNEIHFNTGNDEVGELESTLRVYPNPANDYLTIEGAMTFMEVYNTMGQCLIAKEVNHTSTQVSLAGLSNGIYFLRVYNNGDTVVRKFSVNR